MFQQRLYNPYENMPCLKDNTFYLVNTAEELLTDLKKSITLFEVSQYLTTKVEETWKEYQIQRQLKPTNKSIYNRLVSNQIDEIKQKKYERNLKVMKDHCGQFQLQFKQIKKIAKLIRKNLQMQNIKNETSFGSDEESKDGN